MIDIRKDSIYIRILYENDSKVDSMTSHIGFWLKKNPLENLIVLPLEFSRLERSGLKKQNQIKAAIFRS